MIDVRKIAQARAASARKEIGSGVESERKRAREAARLEANSYQGQNVRMIAADADQGRRENGKLRTCAYCRVSTDDVGQIISIEYQKNNYRDKIKGNPEWIYVGTYVDDGFSGTNTEHRPAFQLMMKRAMAGEIDRIITKSVSRFARNLLDCMGWIEELSKHDPPIGVYFEQENLDTLAQTSNIILFVLAMVAEEESHMKSEAMQLSLEWRFSRGRFLTPELFGYDKVEVPDGFGGKRKVLQVNEEEANVVRWLYSTLVSGGDLKDMAAVLTDMKIPTKGRRRDGTLNTHWTASKIAQLLRNEKYAGDVLARKTYTPNFKNHKARKNNGKKNKYYQAGHHEAIVSRSLWNAAQRILNSRRYGHKGNYLPIHMVTEGTLTGYISMSLHWAGYVAEDYYRSSSIAMGLAEGEMEADLENEHLPNGGYRISGLMDDQGIQQIARELTREEIRIKKELEGQKEEDAALRHSDSAVKIFQVVSGDMFSRATDPVIHISRGSISFNKTCVKRLEPYVKDGYVELLFNPVERMLIVRPCGEETPNAIPWNNRPKGAKALSKIFYEIMDWGADYAYKIPASLSAHGGDAVLVFDMDNYIGCAGKEKDAIISVKENASEKESVSDEESETKGIYYGPEDEEPQPIDDMDSRFQELLELEKRIYGTPAFQHQSDIRGFEDSDQREGMWDMLIAVRALDQDHSVAETVIGDMLQEIINNPPQMPTDRKPYGSSTEAIISDAIVVKTDTLDGIDDGEDQDDAP